MLPEGKLHMLTFGLTTFFGFATALISGRRFKCNINLTTKWKSTPEPEEKYITGDL